MIDWELSTNQGGGANKGPKMSVCEVRSSRSWLQHIIWAGMLWKSKSLFAVHFTDSACRPQEEGTESSEKGMQHTRALGSDLRYLVWVVDGSKFTKSDASSVHQPFP